MSQRQKQKGATRDRIVGSAIRQMKTEGLSTASVAEIMARAGLTVGGFYAHFASKDALAEEAVRHAVAERRAKFLERFDGLAWDERTCCAIGQYFAKEHRDDPASGCPLAMATLEAGRNEAISPAFSEEFARFAEALQRGKRPDDAPAPREAALGTLALMVGGMLLARALKGHPVSDEILDAAKSFGTAAVREFAARRADTRSESPVKRPGNSDNGQE
jgi:TetR/AcrR family transcriptional regulator, transcriptional repressor for nem operon